jgi:UDP-N-acetylglucosamine transferase subunit ALG13
VIFVTVGTQLAFDRLITAVDEWAGAAAGREVFAQIGPSRLQPRHIQHAQFVTPEECSERMLAAKAIVAHAGVGTILTALEIGKSLLVMPRRAALGEHRNDHQLATAHRFAELGTIKVAFDQAELPLRLDELDRVAPQPRISPSAPDDFVAGLRAFIVGQPLLPAASEATRTRSGVKRIGRRAKASQQRPALEVSGGEALEVSGGERPAGDEADLAVDRSGAALESRSALESRY